LILHRNNNSNNDDDDEVDDDDDLSIKLNQRTFFKCPSDVPRKATVCCSVPETATEVNRVWLYVNAGGL
jgi:hypothetical protein